MFEGRTGLGRAEAVGEQADVFLFASGPAVLVAEEQAGVSNGMEWNRVGTLLRCGICYRCCLRCEWHWAGGGGVLINVTLDLK